MGFTIDMISGEVLDESSTQTTDKLSSNEHSNDLFEYVYTEQVSVIEPVSEEADHDVGSMPSCVTQVDVDTFVDEFN